MSERERILEAFYKKVIKLTLEHRVINDNAVIFTSDLGEALQTVNHEWYKETE